MAKQYRYATYNPGQYAAEVHAAWDQMSEDGWEIVTALPNYNEVYILWQRDKPAEEKGKKGTSSE